jgi:hypothetical protein
MKDFFDGLGAVLVVEDVVLVVEAPPAMLSWPEETGKRLFR